MRTKNKKAGRPKKLPQNVKEIIDVIQKNEYATMVSVSEHYGVSTSALMRYEFHDEVKKATEMQRMTAVQRMDKILQKRCEMPFANSGLFTLFYKRYGNKEVRDSLKDTTVIEQKNDELQILDEWQ
jgi:hypothetical protein